MRFEFMTPDIWDGLVLAVVLIGLALAVLQLYRDLSGPGPDTRKAPPALKPPSLPADQSPKAAPAAARKRSSAPRSRGSKRRR